MGLIQLQVGVRPKYCKNTCLTSRNILSGLKAEAYFGDEAVEALVKGIQGRVRIDIDVVGVVLNAERQHRTEARPVSVR